MNTKNDSVSEQQKNLQTAPYILQFSKKSVHFVSTRAHLRASRRDETLTFLGTLTDVSRIWLTFVRCRPAQGPVQNPKMDLFGCSWEPKKRPQVAQKEVVHFAFCILATFWKRHQRRWCLLLCTNECVPKKHFHVNFLTLEGGIDVPKARWRG